MTRDGALDIAEFTAAMHLVVLRRNNIPIPSSLPTCLLPNLLYKTLNLPHEPLAEADLLHLESDTDNDNKENVSVTSEYKRMSSSTYETPPKTIAGGTITIINKSSTLPKNHHSQYRLDFDDTSNNNNSSSNSSSKTILINKTVISASNNNNNNNNNKAGGSPFDQFVVDGVAPIADPASTQVAQSPTKSNKEWTKFTESPTSNVSSPGPKPVNVTQAIVSDTHVVHPVPLRVTPVGPDSVDDEAMRTFRKADSLVYESGVIIPSHEKKSQSINLHNQRDSLPSDFRAIQRPQPKKPASKNIGAIPPPPPQRENSFNHNEETGNNNTSVIITSNNSSVILTNKKEAPPLPPPRLVYFGYLEGLFAITCFLHLPFRPHRHTRSSSLDLQKIKLSNAQQPSQDNEEDQPSSKPPENPPPRISDKKTVKMASYDAYVTSDASFADFAHFPTESNVSFSDFPKFSNFSDLSDISDFSDFFYFPIFLNFPSFSNFSSKIL